MTRLLTMTLVLTGVMWASPVLAQVPPAVYVGYGGLGGTGYAGQGAPYTRQNQPLSPYLNLEFGRNRAVNYFNGVRPFTNASRPGSPIGPGGLNAIGGRTTFFPNAITEEELALPLAESKGPPSPTGRYTTFAPFAGATPSFSTFGAPSFAGGSVMGQRRTPLLNNAQNQRPK